MDINYVMLLIVAVIFGLAYGLMGFFADRVKNGGVFDWPKLAATVVYSIIIGIVAANTGVVNLTNLGDFQTILSPVWQMYAGVYLGLIYIFSKIIVPVVQQFTSKTTLYPKKAAVDPARKMDAETRKWLVSDQKDAISSGVLRCVDAAEAKTTYRYAIEAGAWIYLVEFGEVTGAKHYFFRGWFGTSDVSWKPITSECLEQIRSTGKFPEYSDLY
jgi:hypothetical protein